MYVCIHIYIYIYIAVSLICLVHIFGMAHVHALTVSWFVTRARFVLRMYGNLLRNRHKLHHPTAVLLSCLHTFLFYCLFHRIFYIFLTLIPLQAPTRAPTAVPTRVMPLCMYMYVRMCVCSNVCIHFSVCVCMCVCVFVSEQSTQIIVYCDLQNKWALLRRSYSSKLVQISR